jgi:hypothetical protein
MQTSNSKTFKVRSQQILDNTEADWRDGGLHPRTPEGGWPANLAHTITRESDDRLVVVNTEGFTMIFEVRS